MNRTLLFLALLAALALAAVTVAAPANSHSVERTGNKPLPVTKAPIVPDGTTEGAVTDFVVTFANLNPTVPGIGIKQGGKISLTLPEAFVQKDGAAPITMVVLQGWAQSPRLPFPDPVYDEATNTLTGTMGFDYLPMGPDNPGPKQLHLILPGFENPKRGVYHLKLTIQPDPLDPYTIVRDARVRIIGSIRPSINAINVINGAPPPPFPNSVFQFVEVGEKPLQWGFYIWDKGGVPHVGLSLKKVTETKYELVNPHGKSVGVVRIRAPKGANGFFIDADDSIAATGAVLGIPTGLMIAQFHPDTDTPGFYGISWKLKRGNKIWQFVKVG